MCAPILETVLSSSLVPAGLLPWLARPFASESDPTTEDPEPVGPVFYGPSIDEFYPDPVLFIGTPFEMNRIMIIRVVVALLVMLIVWIAVSRFKLVPGRFQGAVEYVLGVPRRMASDLLGEHDGKRFLPLLTTIFVTVLAMNFTGIIPPANIAGTSVIGLPLVLTVVAYVTFIYAGLRKHGLKFFKNALFPAGVPKPLYIIVAPIELISTFVLRPVTLVLRLLMNMLVGHLLLVLFFVATSFFLFEMDGAWKALSVGTFAIGFAWSAFEILVAILQAYVFTILTALYIQLSLADEH